jgi:hypothetical protein
VPFSLELLSSQASVRKHTHNYTYCFRWALNLVSRPEEERRLRGFRNKELKRMFGPEKQEGAKDGCIKSLNGELHNLFSS